MDNLELPPAIFRLSFVTAAVMLLLPHGQVISHALCTLHQVPWRFEHQFRNRE
ncbi:hypothetical protein [Frigoriglobus tundricola]|uniref:hypothetical protein n=1 Tax=Frigoriglobus tundricola TaxID=2774151 RepID=UPI00148EC4FA|nr:hypothetical protein [Frigoriglobus tundricola]